MTKRSMKKTPKGNYEVGYCKPPEDAKWPPGQSGNPSGRPKKPPSVDEIVLEEGLNQVKAKMGDKVVEIPQINLMIKSLYRKASMGHGPAIKHVLAKYEQAYQAFLKKQAEPPPEVPFSWTEEQEQLLQEIKAICCEVDKRIPSSDN